MKTKISFCAMILAVITLLCLMTACGSSNEEDWRIVHPLEDAEKIKFSLTRKTDIIDYSPMKDAPEEVVFTISTTPP